MGSATTRPPTTTTAPPTEAPPTEPKGQPMPSGGDLKQYNGVPAVVNGHCSITLRVAPTSEGPGRKEQDEVVDAFKQVLGQELKLQVNIADVEGLHLRAVGHPHDRTLMILWTAGTVRDGGRLLL